MEAYRSPSPERESPLPTLVWPRELPIEGEPADVVAIVEDYGQWMATSSVPKLFINAEPGSLLIGRSRDFCRAWPNQGNPFHSGGQPKRDRNRTCGVLTER